MPSRGSTPSVEAQVLLSVVRGSGTPPLGEVDWDRLIDLALRHRVLPYLVRAGLGGPPSICDRLRNLERASTGHALLVDLELDKALRLLQTLGAPSIVLKGPALARTVYPDRFLRPHDDIDLTIHPEDEDRVIESLLDSGYRELRVGHEEQRREHAGHLEGGAAYHRVFRRDDSVVPLELHLDPLQLGLQTVCEAERWRRAQVTPALPGTLILCPEDQVVQLSLHALKHGYDRLIWIKDIDVMLRHYRDTLDWELVRRVARLEGVSASVWYTLRLSKMLLATPVSDAALRSMRPLPHIRMLYELVWPRRRIANLEGHWRRRAVQFLAADSWRGTLPNLILMGRRRDRAAAVLQIFFPHRD
jgi:hypothetical protein